jgi:phage anti-repressor protein
MDIADLVNQGISTARGIYAAYTIKLSINKNLKLKKRKGKGKQQRKKLYTLP